MATTLPPTHIHHHTSTSAAIIPTFMPSYSKSSTPKWLSRRTTAVNLSNDSYSQFYVYRSPTTAEKLLGTILSASNPTEPPLQKGKACVQFSLASSGKSSSSMPTQVSAKRYINEITSISLSSLTAITAPPTSLVSSGRRHRRSYIISLPSPLRNWFKSVEQFLLQESFPQPEVEISLSRHEAGSVHVAYESYERIDLPAPQGVKGIYIPLGSNIMITNTYTRRVILTQDTLARIEGQDSPLASFYADAPDGIYIPDQAYVETAGGLLKRRMKTHIKPVKVHIPKELAAQNALENAKDVTLTVQPMSNIIVVAGGKVKTVFVTPVTFLLQDGPKKVRMQTLARVNNEELLGELEDLEVVRKEEVEPKKKTRWWADGIDENQVPKGRMSRRAIEETHEEFTM
ncbi:hypothetical protein BDQ17DRAFT_1330503 [Cyathus striatus]|nr:hypothetical protein BDQ17DRAFT_1330503 [Cyathus striatus]